MHRFAILFAVLGLCAAVLCGQSSSAAKRDRERPQQPIPSAERLDLNHASLDDLLRVPGITHTWAERIVRFRPYRTRLDLLQEGVLPPEVYNRIKDAVIVHREKK